MELTLLVVDVENKQLRFVEEADDEFVFEDDDSERIEIPKEFFGSKAVFLRGE